MTRLQQRLAGLAVLTIVATVSLLAGGIILGSASADGGDEDAPATASVRVTSSAVNGEQMGCVIAFGSAPGESAALPQLTVKDLPALEFRPVEGAAPVNIKIVRGDGVPGDAPTFSTTPIEAKPLSDEDIEMLKADRVLREINPEDCTIINPELMPEGWTPGKPLGAGVGAGGASFNIVMAKP